MGEVGVSRLFCCGTIQYNTFLFAAYIECVVDAFVKKIVKD